MELKTFLTGLAIAGEVVAAILYGFIMALSSDISYDGEISSAIAEELKENFYSAPITSLTQTKNFNIQDNKIRNLKEELGLELGLSYVNFGSWQGTNKGCGKIKEDNTVEVKVLEESKKCAEDEQFLDSIDGSFIRNYSGIMLNKKTLRKNYYQLLEEGSIVSQKEQCPHNKKNCGFIDTLKNKLCIDETDECPINYIEMGTEKPEGVNITNTINGIGKNMYISTNPYPNKENDNYLIANFKIAGSKICSLPNLYWTDGKIYPLDKILKMYSTNCILKDYSVTYQEDNVRYQKLDEMEIYDLYEGNNIINDITKSNLVNYGYDVEKYFKKGKLLSLYYRPFFGFNKACLEERTEKFNIDQLLDLEKKHTQAANMETWGTWAMSLSTFGELMAIFNAFDLKNNEFKPSFYISHIVGVVSTIYNLIRTWIANDYDDAYQDEFTCSDYITNQNYNLMTQKINQSGKHIRICIYLTFSYVVAYLIIFVSQLLKKLNE